MRVLVRNLERVALFESDVNHAARPEAAAPRDGRAEQVGLRWDKAVDGDGYLCGCPVCGCRELYARKDFPQKPGMAIVVACVVLVLGLFARRQIVLGFAVMFGLAAVDAVVYQALPRCLVCYRCRSEFRGAPVRADQPGWNLAVGEKYRGAA